MRYFLIFYTGQTTESSENFSGVSNATVNNYPNRIEAEKLIADSVEEEFEEEVSFISITNIIELNEEDFNNFIK